MTPLVEPVPVILSTAHRERCSLPVGVEAVVPEYPISLRHGFIATAVVCFPYTTLLQTA